MSCRCDSPEANLGSLILFSLFLAALSLLFIWVDDRPADPYALKNYISYLSLVALGGTQFILKALLNFSEEPHPTSKKDEWHSDRKDRVFHRPLAKRKSPLPQDYKNQPIDIHQRSVLYFQSRISHHPQTKKANEQTHAPHLSLLRNHLRPDYQRPLHA